MIRALLLSGLAGGLLLISGCGASNSASPAVGAKRPSHFRVIDLGGEGGTFKVVTTIGKIFSPVDESAAFSRMKSGDITVELDRPSGKSEQKLTVEGDKASTMWLLADGKSVVTVEPREPKGGRAAIAFVNLTNAEAELTGDLTAKAGPLSASVILPFVGGSADVSAAGQSLKLDIDPERAYTIFLYEKSGKPTLGLLMNNPSMNAAPAGGSPAG